MLRGLNLFSPLPFWPFPTQFLLGQCYHPASMRIEFASLEWTLRTKTGHLQGPSQWFILSGRQTGLSRTIKEIVKLSRQTSCLLPSKYRRNSSVEKAAQSVSASRRHVESSLMLAGRSMVEATQLITTQPTRMRPLNLMNSHDITACLGTGK